MIVIFRGLLAVSTMIFIFNYWLPLFDNVIYSEDMLNLRRWDGWGAVLPAIPLLNISLFVFAVMVPVFMFFFVPWARAAFFVLTIVYVTLNLGWGIRVTPPMEAFWGQVISLLDGAILALAYFSSVAGRFSRPVSSSS